MDFIDFIAAGFLVQAVDVLGDHAFQLSCALKLRQFIMSGIGLCPSGVQVFPIVRKENFRLFVKAVIAQQVFRFVFGEALLSLAVEAVLAAEVRDALQQPVGRVGTPMDIASMVMFLCSDKAGFITGENICIDGGMTKLMIYHDDCGWTYTPEE